MPHNLHIQNYQYEEKMRSLLVDLAGLDKKADLYTLYSMCKDKDIEKIIKDLLDCRLIEECEVCVFNTDFICYSVTQDGFEYLKIRPGDGKS